MPASPESLALAEQYRRRAVLLRDQFVREFRQLWPGVAALADPELRATWLRLATALVQQWRPIFRRAALVYHRQAVALDLGPAAPLAAAAAAPPASTVGAGLVVATLVAVAPSIIRGPGLELLPARLAQVSAQALQAGAQALARLALAGGREAIESTVQRDRVALGWMRVTDEDPCAFCLMLASRGPVYKSARAAGFEPDPVRGEINRYHDNCQCQVVPVFTRDPVLPETTQRWQEVWETAQREARESGELRRDTSNDALNALRRFRDRDGAALG